jgi:aminopeptidase-like protein
MTQNFAAQPLSTSDDQMEMIRRLTPLRRSIVTDDVDVALAVIRDYLPINTVAIPSGTECWTWPVPQKWTLRSAKVTDENGQVVLDGNEHALAVAPYSQAFEGEVSRDELVRHLRWSEEYPDAFVYEYRYAYNSRMHDWCMSMPYERVKALNGGRYRVSLDAGLSPGEMKIAEAFLPGRRKETIVIISHLCHPGQSNDGIAGVAGAARLYRALAERDDRNWSYLFLFPPETIGSVGYLWARQEIIPQLRCGIVLEMIGVEAQLCLKTSHRGDAAIDRVAKHVFSSRIASGDMRVGSFREMYGNDEIVFADPDFDVPMIGIQRHPFPEYHTSRDNPDSVVPERLDEAHDAAMAVIDLLETDYIPQRLFKGPLYLSRFDLYVEPRQDLTMHRQAWNVMQRLGTGKSVFEIAEELGLQFDALRDYLARWQSLGLLSATPSNLLAEK